MIRRLGAWIVGGVGGVVVPLVLFPYLMFVYDTLGVVVAIAVTWLFKVGRVSVGAVVVRRHQGNALLETDGMDWGPFTPTVRDVAGWNGVSVALVDNRKAVVTIDADVDEEVRGGLLRRAAVALREREIVGALSGDLMYTALATAFTVGAFIWFGLNEAVTCWIAGYLARLIGVFGVLNGQERHAGQIMDSDAHDEWVACQQWSRAELNGYGPMRRSWVGDYWTRRLVAFPPVSGSGGSGRLLVTEIAAQIWLMLRAAVERQISRRVKPTPTTQREAD